VKAIRLHPYDEGHTSAIYLLPGRVVSVEPAPPYSFEDVKATVTLETGRVIHVTEGMDEVMAALGWERP
jgi:hypothetical protein